MKNRRRKYIAICTDWIAEYELYVAQFYYKKGSYKAAVGRCEKLLKDYPGLALGKGRALLRGPVLYGTRRAGPGARQVRDACAEISGHEGNGTLPSSETVKAMKYYPAYLDLRERPCVVIGGGAVAERKALSLLEAGAVVTIISPALTPKLHELLRLRQNHPSPEKVR